MQIGVRCDYRFSESITLEAAEEKKVISFSISLSVKNWTQREAAFTRFNDPETSLGITNNCGIFPVTGEGETTKLLISLIDCNTKRDAVIKDVGEFGHQKETKRRANPYESTITPKPAWSIVISTFSIATSALISRYRSIDKSLKVIEEKEPWIFIPKTKIKSNQGEVIDWGGGGEMSSRTSPTRYKAAIRSQQVWIDPSVPFPAPKPHLHSRSLHSNKSPAWLVIGEDFFASCRKRGCMRSFFAADDLWEEGGRKEIRIVEY